MSRIPDLRRIDSSDFDSDSRDMVDKLAFPLNSFMEQTRAAFDKAIDFTNLNQEVITFTVATDANGVPVQKTQYKNTLKTKVVGISLIDATNQTIPSHFPTSQPFIKFTESSNIVTLKYVSSLQPNEKYQIVIISYGSTPG